MDPSMEPAPCDPSPPLELLASEDAADAAVVPALPANGSGPGEALPAILLAGDEEAVTCEGVAGGGSDGDEENGAPASTPPSTPDVAAAAAAAAAATPEPVGVAAADVDTEVAFVPAPPKVSVKTEPVVKIEVTDEELAPAAEESAEATDTTSLDPPSATLSPPQPQPQPASSPGQYPCEKCNVILPSLPALERHLKKQHACGKGPTGHEWRPLYKVYSGVQVRKRPPKGYREFECPKCMFIALKQKDIDAHVSEKHRGRSDRIKCGKCAKVLKGKAELREHVLANHLSGIVGLDG